MTHIIVNNDQYGSLLLSCDVCEAEIITIVRKVLTYFTNIMLNLYTTALSDTISDTKIVKENYLHLLDVIMPLTHMINYIIITLCTLNCINMILSYFFGGW